MSESSENTKSTAKKSKAVVVPNEKSNMYRNIQLYLQSKRPSAVKRGEQMLVAYFKRYPETINLTR